MKTDLHNHTFYCNHAEGTMDEYVLRAIELGYNIFGFADHAPLDYDQGYRMSVEQMDEYEKTVRKLAKDYLDKIDILLGYEVDYLPGFMVDEVFERDVDYFIGAVHFLDNWGFDNPQFMSGYQDRDPDQTWNEFFLRVEALAQSGHFDIIAHLDLLKVFNFLPTSDIAQMATRALEAIRDNNLVIEINAAGIRKPIAEQYPTQGILDKAFKMGIPITFSSDSHKLEQIGFSRQKIENAARKAGYTKCAVFKKRQINMVEF